jgi:hypothetical protein
LAYTLPIEKQNLIKAHSNDLSRPLTPISPQEILKFILTSLFIILKFMLLLCFYIETNSSCPICRKSSILGYPLCVLKNPIYYMMARCLTMAAQNNPVLFCCLKRTESKNNNLYGVPK